MIKNLVNLILSLRNFGQNLGRNFFEAFRDPQTGKLRGLKPDQIKPLLLLLFFLFFALILGTQIK